MKTKWFQLYGRQCTFNIYYLLFHLLHFNSFDFPLKELVLQFKHGFVIKALIINVSTSDTLPCFLTLN